jgi:D-arginine dehydrogenase
MGWQQVDRGDGVRIAVIGGGMAGVSIGYELAARASVVVLEQERELAYHTTGRSAAMYLQSYGNAVVRALTAASGPGFRHLERSFSGPALLTEDPVLWVADESARPALDALLSTDAPLRPVSPAGAIALCPALRRERLVGGAVDVSARRIDVMGLHRAYVTGLLARGGAVRRPAPVTGLEPTPEGWTVRTPDGSFAVDTVVNASGAWADRIAYLAGVAPAGIRPLRRTLFTSPVRWPEPIHGWPFVADCAERYYFKAEHDQVMASPADEAPDQPRDTKPEEIDIARALEIINEHTTLGLRSVRSSWAGLRCFAGDRCPVVGCRRSEPGFFWFAGQGGYGIQMAPALARLGAALLLGLSLPPDLEGLIDPAALSPERAMSTAVS